MQPITFPYKIIEGVRKFLAASKITAACEQTEMTTSDRTWREWRKVQGDG